MMNKIKNNVCSNNKSGEVYFFTTRKTQYFYWQ